jgi:hypothetical protein
MTRRKKIITASIASLPFSLLGILQAISSSAQWYIILGCGLFGLILVPVFWATLPRE